jgi:hypothetical protein
MAEHPLDSVLGPKYTHLLRTRAYLKSLPDGLDSYPECRSKGAVWKNILRWTHTEPLAERLPSDVPLVPQSDILASSWISAVQSFAGHLVLRDCLFPNDDAICEHFRVMDRRLLSSPLYKVMFALASPNMAVQGADRHFASMFQGITLKAKAVEEHQVLLTLRYPRMLLPALVGRLYLVAFEVAVELAGGKSVAGKVLSHDETAARYEILWR